MNCLILAVDDSIRSLVEKALRGAGHPIERKANGEVGLSRFMRGSLDVAVIHIILPKRDGLSILRALGESGSSIPILLRMARSAVTERVEVLQTGADDHHGKPFHLEELIAGGSIAAVIQLLYAPKMVHCPSTNSNLKLDNTHDHPAA